jgi:hypothetical protein
MMVRRSIWGGLKDDAPLAPGEDLCDSCIESNIHPFRPKVFAPVGVEFGQFREGHHCGEVRKEGVRIIVPKLHIRIVEEAFEDGAGYICRLIAYVAC